VGALTLHAFLRQRWLNTPEKLDPSPGTESGISITYK
jgi:hypothetical protein